jgi:hypothetical protein
MSSSNGTVTYSAAYLAQDQRPFAVSIIIPMIVLSGLAVAGRLASRKIKRIPWLIDDWVCILALVCHPKYDRPSGVANTDCRSSHGDALHLH